jgi:hypothetical protein
MAQYAGYGDLKIGASVVGLTALSALTYSGSNANVPPPRTSFQECVQTKENSDGDVKKLGKPIITWDWPDGLHYAAWQALRDELTDPEMSGTRYIASPDKDGNIQNWACKMQWSSEPVQYSRFDYRTRLTIRFTRCVQQ